MGPYLALDTHNTTLYEYSYVYLQHYTVQHGAYDKQQV